jgi:hypothetical protein
VSLHSKISSSREAKLQVINNCAQHASASKTRYCVGHEEPE